MATASIERRSQPKLPSRRDLWWIQPVLTVLVLVAFGLYAFWSGVIAETGHIAEPYLSPFYSPLIITEWWPLSPALLVMWATLFFRITCYYYRKSYYRAFFWDPPSCTVGELRGTNESYGGETRFPYILQNLHRYLWWASSVVLLFLWYDTIKAFFFHEGFGIGAGSVILLVNVILLSGYSLSCHSFRHIVGGKVNCFSCTLGGRVRYKLWSWASVMNVFHGQWAWFSLVVVALTDIYIRLVAAGTITDPRIIF